jgi:hypothetical protein
VALRLYGTGVEFCDQTWKLDDVVKVGAGGRALQKLTRGEAPNLTGTTAGRRDLV